MSERYWFYAQDNKSVGPIPEAQLRQLIAQGTIKPDTLIYSDILTDWTPASVVEALRTRAAFSPPQSPAAPQTDSEIYVKRGVSMSMQFEEKKSAAAPPPPKPSAPSAESPSQPIRLKSNDPPPAPASDISKPKRIALKAQSSSESPPPSPPPHMPPAPRPPIAPPAPPPSARRTPMARPWYITVICLLSFIGGGCGLLCVGGIFALPGASGKMTEIVAATNQELVKQGRLALPENIVQIFLFVALISVVANIVAMIGYWNMRRWGVYLYGLMVALNIGYALVSGFPLNIFGFIVPAIVLLAGFLAFREMA